MNIMDLIVIGVIKRYCLNLTINHVEVIKQNGYKCGWIKRQIEPFRILSQMFFPDQIAIELFCLLYSNKREKVTHHKTLTTPHLSYL